MTDRHLGPRLCRPSKASLSKYELAGVRILPTRPGPPVAVLRSESPAVSTSKHLLQMVTSLGQSKTRLTRTRSGISVTGLERVERIRLARS
jgi:hypothetical protein